ncbi:MAG: hypothetical protein M1541_10145 [Acidobacteria bacterium]|nr:hypothetical protein [Acidobacteriota bacterium]
MSAQDPKLHHRDVVGAALRRMNRQLRSGEAAEVLRDMAPEGAGGAAASEAGDALVDSY